MTSTSRPKVLFLVTEDRYFLSHRLELAKALHAQGAEIVVATATGDSIEKIQSYGFTHFPVCFRRKSINPFREVLTLFEVIRLYREVKPNLVHHVAIKPVVYGSIAAKVTQVPATVNTITGLGYAFTTQGWLPTLIRNLLKVLFRIFLDGKNSKLILQNHDDFDYFCRTKLITPSRATVILGSGVDTNRFYPVKDEIPKSDNPRILLPARLLWDKGVGEFVEASRILASRGVKVRMQLCGFCDQGNPSTVPEEKVLAWVAEGLVEWLGHQQNMPEVLKDCDIVCLPSYREGVPLALIEAASAGKAIVTTDVPGCREIVKDGLNGLLVPVKNAYRLADAIESLACDPNRRARMGAKGRQMVLEGFSKEHVITSTLAVYRELLAGLFPSFLRAN